MAATARFAEIDGQRGEERGERPRSRAPLAPLAERAGQMAVLVDEHAQSARRGGWQQR